MKIWETSSQSAGELRLREALLPGSVSIDGKKRYCRDYDSIETIAKFYAAVSQKNVKVHSDEEGWWCWRPDMPTASVEGENDCEQDAASIDGSLVERRASELAFLRVEDDLPGALSSDSSLRRCGSFEEAQLIARFYRLTSGKPVQIWQEGTVWAIETHKLSRMAAEAALRQESLRAEERRSRGVLTESERWQQEVELERERIQAQWEQDRPKPGW